MNDAIEEREFSKKIKGYLDTSASGLKSGTAYRLKAARERALAQLAAPASEQVTGRRLAAAGGSVSGGGSGGLGVFGGVRFWAAVIGLAIAVWSYSQWQEVQAVKEIEEIDAAILSGDLPIDAFLDTGFQNWLKRDGLH